MTAPPRIQPGVWTILTPRWRGALARVRQERKSRAKFLLLALRLQFPYFRQNIKHLYVKLTLLLLLRMAV